jgi:hypothetical protein
MTSALLPKRSLSQYSSLDVVVGARLDGLDRLGIGDGETGNDEVELGEGVGGKRRHFGQVGSCGQGLQPFDLDADAIADQAEFGEVDSQRLDLGGIAAVERRKCGKRGEIHGVVICKKMRGFYHAGISALGRPGSERRQ